MRLLFLLLFHLALLIANSQEEDLFFYVESPPNLSYSYQIQPANALGPRFPEKSSTSLQLVYAYPAHACTTIQNLLAYGKVLLIERGECSFFEKAQHAEDVGARYVIITDSEKNDHENVDMISDDGSRVNTPVAYLIGASGRKLRDYLMYGKENIYITIPLNHSLTSLKDIPSKPPWEYW